MFDHVTSEGSDRLGNLEAGQLAHLGSSEPVHRVGTDLQRQLATVQHFLFERIRLLLQICLGFLSCRQQGLENFWEQAFSYAALDKQVAAGSFNVLVGGEVVLGHGARREQRGVAQVVGHHDAWVQGGKIQSRDWYIIIA